MLFGLLYTGFAIVLGDYLGVLCVVFDLELVVVACQCLTGMLGFDFVD